MSGSSSWLGVIYGLGYLGTTIATQVVVTWVAYFYAPAPDRGLTIFLPVGMVGTAMAIGRVVDALADPLVAVWSDNTRSRWGRRRPFIVAGAPLLVLSFYLIWRPPVQGVHTINFYYLVLVLSAFFFFFTVVVAPYLALLPEIARSRRERVGLAAWQGVFNIVGAVIAMVGSALLAESLGFPAMGLVLGIVILVAFYVSGIGVREPSALGRTPGPPLVEAVKLTLRNRPFRYFLAGQIFYWFGFNMVMMTIAYYVTVVMGLTEGHVALVLGLTLAVALASFPLITSMTARVGTKKALMWVMGLFTIILTALASIGKWPLPVSTAIQGLVVIGLAGIPLAGLFILPNAIVAEITDYDEQLTGKRREAIYYGVQGFLLKAAIGLSSLLVTYLLETFGYSPSQPLGVVISGPVAALFVFIGLLVFAPFPLGKPVSPESIESQPSE